MPDLSVVIPVFQSRAVVGAMIDRTLATLDTIPGNHELVAVNDGSRPTRRSRDEDSRTRPDSASRESASAGLDGRRQPRSRPLLGGEDFGDGTEVGGSIRAVRAQDRRLARAAYQVPVEKRGFAD